jgi:DNA repair ATPase RecN
MTTKDLYYTQGSTTIFYSSLHAFKGTEFKVNSDWWEAHTEEAISKIIEGKLRYEHLKLVVSPDEINTMLQKALEETTLKSTIEQALDSSLTEMKADIDRVTNSFKRAIPQVQDAVEELSKVIAATSSYKRSVDSATKAIELTKEKIPTLDSVKDSLTEAKNEFNQVTTKLKELFQ